MLSIPWQERFRRGVSRPGVRLAGLSVGRSCGKSYFCASLARDYMRDGDPETEALVVSYRFNQSKIILKYVLSQLRDEGHDLEDKTRWAYSDSANRAFVLDRSTGVTVRAMTSKAAGLHGRVWGRAYIDEPRELEAAQRDDLLAALTSGMGKVSGAQIVALGCMPHDRAHWFFSWMHGEADYFQSHQARRDESPFTLKQIRRANPSYDYLPSLREDLLARREKAREYPDSLAEWRSRHLNMGTADRKGGMFLDPEQWVEVVEADIPPKRRAPCVWGLDPGGASAFSAMACYSASTGLLEGFQAVGGVPSLTVRAKHDQAGKLYAGMEREGSLVVYPGRERPAIITFLQEGLRRYGRPRLIVSDHHRAPEVRDALRLARLRVELVVRHTQPGPNSTEDIRRAQKLLLDERRVHVARNIAWPASIGESRLEVNPKDQMSLATGTQSKRRRRARTDLTSAMVVALAEADRRWPGGAVRRGPVRLVRVG